MKPSSQPPLSRPLRYASTHWLTQSRLLVAEALIGLYTSGFWTMAAVRWCPAMRR